MSSIPQERKVFVSRNFRMDSIEAIGFDMDYTLARYRRKNLEALAFRLTAQNLVEMGYPSAITEIEYDPDFIVRGLALDKETGHLLKLDRHKYPTRVMRGLKSLNRDEIIALYGQGTVYFSPPRFAFVDTLFALPEICLYAKLVDYYDSLGEAFDPWKLYEDTRDAIDKAHRDGSLKSEVRADIGFYVEKEKELAKTLHKFRSAGKKLFVLTNSFWEYTNALMGYLLDGEDDEYSSWMQYFDLVVVGGAKPGFFSDSKPFGELDMETGKVVQRPAKSLVRGKAYEGGNLKDLEAQMGVSGPKVLYVGDHIFGDILRSKKQAAWRTALVVEELEDELLGMERQRPQILRIRKLEDQRRILDGIANRHRRTLSAIEKEHGKDDAGYRALKKERDQTKSELKSVIKEQEELSDEVHSSFNPHWGMIFKDQGDNTRFAEQVQDYACVYTGRLTNFYYYSAYQYFRSPRDILPHEGY